MLGPSIGNFHRLFFKTAHFGEILCGETYIKLWSLKNKHYIPAFLGVIYSTDTKTRLKRMTAQMPGGHFYQ